jgi:hypothetical protein
MTASTSVGGWGEGITEIEAVLLGGTAAIKSGESVDIVNISSN